MYRFGYIVVLVISIAMLLGASWLLATLSAWTIASALLVIAVVLAFQAPQAWRAARRVSP